MDVDRERAARGSGTRLTPNAPKRPDPAIPDDVTGGEIDFTVKRELRTLSKENAAGVAAHLVMVGRLLDVDLEGAQAHAETAVRRAGRVASVREARGLVAYRAGDWALALSEFRTARRLAGDHHLLPLMVDCERALGRPERALELATGPEASTLAPSEQMELRIVVSGIRRDLGQLDAALVGLRGPQLDPSKRLPWSARLFYAYADALLENGDEQGARDWFAHAVDADTDLETDAAERLEEIDGIVVVDLLEGEDDEDADSAAQRETANTRAASDGLDGMDSADGLDSHEGDDHSAEAGSGRAAGDDHDAERGHLSDARRQAEGGEDDSEEVVAGTDRGRRDASGAERADVIHDGDHGGGSSDESEDTEGVVADADRGRRDASDAEPANVAHADSPHGEARGDHAAPDEADGVTRRDDTGDVEDAARPVVDATDAGDDAVDGEPGSHSSPDRGDGASDGRSGEEQQR